MDRRQPAMAVPSSDDSVNKEHPSSFLSIFPRPVHDGFESAVTGSNPENVEACKDVTALLEDVLVMIFKENARLGLVSTVAEEYIIEVSENEVFSKAYKECQEELTPVNFLWDFFVYEMYAKAVGQFLRVAITHSKLPLG